MILTFLDWFFLHLENGISFLQLLAIMTMSLSGDLLQESLDPKVRHVIHLLILFARRRLLETFVHASSLRGN
jgi:hypothetical protein